MKSLQFSGIKMFKLDDILRPEEDFSLSKAFVCLSLFFAREKEEGEKGKGDMPRNWHAQHFSRASFQ